MTTTNNNMHTLEAVRKGFMNGVFYKSGMLVNHLDRLFSGATINVICEDKSTTTIHCQSPSWEKEPYSKTFVFTHETRENGFHKITAIEEI